MLMTSGKNIVVMWPLRRVQSDKNKLN